MTQWFTYILRCNDGSYYVGATNNIDERVKRHNTGKGGAYTASHRPVQLVYSESYATKSEALKREIQIKRWTRMKKENLVRFGNSAPES